jgi:NADPH-dependent 2,4-dienoyl-CoA reductase/sulfur reductase-like enzyme
LYVVLQWGSVEAFLQVADCKLFFSLSFERKEIPLANLHEASPVELAADRPVDSVKTNCCVVGGGPAGMMLSLLLARQGVPVTLLEGHKDFERDFRGDTVHPSTLEILDQLGLAERKSHMASSTRCNCGRRTG